MLLFSDCVTVSNREGPRFLSKSSKLCVEAKGKTMSDVVIKWKLRRKYRSSATVACKGILVVC
jgi:hypothetical protein